MKHAFSNHRGARCWLPTRPDLWDQYYSSSTTWINHLGDDTCFSVVENQTPASLISHHKPAFFVGLESFIIKKTKIEIYCKAAERGDYPKTILWSQCSIIWTNVLDTFPLIPWRGCSWIHNNLCTYTDCLETKDLRFRTPIFLGSTWTTKNNMFNEPKNIPTIKSTIHELRSQLLNQHPLVTLCSEQFSRENGHLLLMTVHH